MIIPSQLSYLLAGFVAFGHNSTTHRFPLREFILPMHVTFVFFQRIMLPIMNGETKPMGIPSKVIAWPKRLAPHERQDHDRAVVRLVCCRSGWTLASPES